VNFHEHPYVFPLPKAKYFDEYCQSGRLLLGYAGLEASGYAAVFTGVHYFSRISHSSWHNLVHALGMLHTDTLKQTSQTFFVAKGSQDIVSAYTAGRIDIIPVTENYDNVLGNQLDNVGVLYGLGLRGLGLTYQTTNLLGGGEMNPKDKLTRFGRDVIKRMDDLGMMLDLSHTNKRTTMEALELSANPCSFSHSLAFGACGIDYAKEDEELQALAENDGIFGLKIRGLLHCRSNPTMDDVLDHLEYVINLIGVDSVAIGPDTWWDADLRYVVGYENASQFLNITRGLVARGYSDNEIEKVIGGNIIRTLSTIEASY
jgi:membrane dipeptidase